MTDSPNRSGPSIQPVDPDCTQDACPQVLRASSLPDGPRIIYFSSSTENTHRFVQRVGLPAVRLPLRRSDPDVAGDAPYVLITPSYGGGRMEPRYAIPKQVMAFLKDETSRNNCVGVISSGNTNFGEAYLVAGRLLSAKLQVPVLYGFELLGTPDDVNKVREGLVTSWGRLVGAKTGDVSP